MPNDDNTTMSSATDVWHVAEDEVHDENGLRVLPVQIVERVRALQEALFGLIWEIDASVATAPFDDGAADVEVTITRDPYEAALRALGVQGY